MKLNIFKKKYKEAKTCDRFWGAGGEFEIRDKNHNPVIYIHSSVELVPKQFSLPNTDENRYISSENINGFSMIKSEGRLEVMLHVKNDKKGPAEKTFRIGEFNSDDIETVQYYVNKLNSLYGIK